MYCFLWEAHSWSSSKKPKQMSKDQRNTALLPYDTQSFLVGRCFRKGCAKNWLRKVDQVWQKMKTNHLRSSNQRVTHVVPRGKGSCHDSMGLGVE